MANLSALLQGFVQGGGGDAFGDLLLKEFDPNSYYKSKGYQKNLDPMYKKNESFFNIDKRNQDGQTWFKPTVNKNKAGLIDLKTGQANLTQEEAKADTAEEKQQELLERYRINNDLSQQKYNYNKDANPIELDLLDLKEDMTSNEAELSNYTLDNKKEKSDQSVTQNANDIALQEQQQDINDERLESMNFDQKVSREEFDEWLGNQDIRNQTKKLDLALKKLGYDEGVYKFEEYKDNEDVRDAMNQLNLDNAELEKELNEFNKLQAEREFEALANGGSSKDIINYYANNPDKFSLAMNRGQISQDTIDKVNEKLGYNVFSPEGDKLSQNLALKLYEREHGTTDALGNVTMNENRPSFQEFYRNLNSDFNNPTNNEDTSSTGGGDETTKTSYKTTGKEIIDKLNGELSNWEKNREKVLENEGKEVAEYIDKQLGYKTKDTKDKGEGNAGNILNKIFNFNVEPNKGFDVGDTPQTNGEDFDWNELFTISPTGNRANRVTDNAGSVSDDVSSTGGNTGAGKVDLSNVDDRVIQTLKSIVGNPQTNEGKSGIGRPNLNDNRLNLVELLVDMFKRGDREAINDFFESRPDVNSPLN